MRRPVVGPSLAFSLGIVLSYYFLIQTRAVFFVSVLFATALLVTYFNRSKWKLFLMIWLVTLGMIYTNIRLVDHLRFYRGETHTYVGTVHRIRNGDSYKSYDIKITSVDGIQSSGMVRGSLSEDNGLARGDQIEFRGILNKPNENTNPGLFNYKKYLMTKNIRNVVRIDEFSIRSLEREPTIGYQLQESFWKRTERVLGENLSTENRGIMLSILTGDKDSLEAEEYNLYRDLGIAHILAISGLHMGILSGFIMLALSRAGVKRHISILVTLSFAWLYGYLIGFTESAVRACIMITILMGSKVIHRPCDRINTLAASYFISILINPFWIFSVGFQLSYGATASLFLLLPWIMERLYPYRGRLSQTAGAVLAVNIGIVPLQSLYFNQIPLMALISNIILVPMATVNLVGGFLMLLMPPLGLIVDKLLTVQGFLAKSLYSIPLLPVSVASPGIHQIIIYITLLAVVLKWKDIVYVDLGIRKTLVVFLLFMGIINPILENRDTRSEIHFIDVGQGDSALLLAGRYSFLIDTGGSLFGDYDPGREITLPYLQKIGIRKLDGIIISHFHEDHYKGIFPVLEKIRVDGLYVNGPIQDLNLLEAVSRHNIPVYLMTEGSVLDLSSGGIIRCIWPREESHSNENNNSLVLLYENQGSRVLFTGDIELEAEKALVAQDKVDIDILKVAHHGSRTSTTVDFLDWSTPQIGVISAGRNNFYSHPHKETLENLHRAGIEIYRTDQSGLIKAEIRQGQVFATSFGGPMYGADFVLFIHENTIPLSWSFLYCILCYVAVSDYNKKEKYKHELSGIL